MSYKIKVYYTSGDSFGTYENVEELDYDWKNKEVAEQNLERIQSHAEWYYQLGMVFNRDSHYKLDFVDGEYDESIRLLLDNGDEFLYSCAWIGCFGRFLHAILVDTEERLPNGLRIKIKGKK